LRSEFLMKVLNPIKQR